MISAIGETQEARNQRWLCMTNIDRDRYLEEIEQWKKDYPFAAEVMLGNKTREEILKYAEERFC